MTQELFITCIPGLESCLEKELGQLGFIVSRQGFAGVYLPFTNLRQVYELNLVLRTASRILLPLASFDCEDREELYREALRVHWMRFFEHFPLYSFAIQAHGQHDAFNNSLFAAQVVKDAICDVVRKKMNQRPTVDTKNPQLRFHLFIQNQQTTIYFDTSGAPLHERGYRQEAGKAPIRENLAAALLQMAGYDKECILVDPCAGAGTLVIEAALIATCTPPQFLRRSFGFMLHPEYCVEEWREMHEQKLSQRTPLPIGHCTAIECNLKTFNALQKAISRVGLEGKISIICNDFRKVKLATKPNFVITNPPYGIRLQNAEEELGILYKGIGGFMKQYTAKPARGFIFCAHNELIKKIGLATKKRHIIHNGGIECRLLEYDIF